MDYARPHRKVDDGFATLPEMTIYSMLPAKVFDKGPSLAVALGLCVGLSFGVGILSGWYSYRSTDASASALWSQDHLQKIAVATDRHRVLIAPTSLTFFDELRQPNKQEEIQLEKQAPPKHLVAALDPAVPVNEGAPKEASVTKKPEPQKKPQAAAVVSGERVPEKDSVETAKEDRGDQMASALARLLGEPDLAPIEATSAKVAAMPAVASAKPKGDWRIQTSLFSDHYRASSLVDHLTSKGYTAKLKPKADGFYIVLISGFKSEDAALNAQENLSREEGLSSTLIRP